MDLGDGSAVARRGHGYGSYGTGMKSIPTFGGVGERGIDWATTIDALEQFWKTHKYESKNLVYFSIFATRGRWSFKHVF